MLIETLIGEVNLTLRVIAVRTGNKYSEWWESNLKHMIDKFSNLNYDEFVIVRDNEYELQVANKLLIFEKFKDGQNIYFDLDLVIKGDCNKFLSKDFKLCSAWWRPAYHTPLNSSIMSWQGDMSKIYYKWESDPEYHMFKYYRGIDQFLYENIKYRTFNKKLYYSFREMNEEKNYPVCLFNQRYEYMKTKGWWTQYLI